MPKRSVLLSCAAIFFLLILLCGLSACFDTGDGGGSSKPVMDDTFQLAVEDADYTRKEGEYFRIGDEMIKFEQAGGGPIYWNYLTVTVALTGTEEEIEMDLCSINGYGIKSNAGDEAYKTTAGDVIVYAIKGFDDEEKIESPNYVDVNIYNGGKNVFKAGPVRVV